MLLGNPQYRLHVEGDQLVAVGGSDEVLLIDDCPQPGVVEELCTLWMGKPVSSGAFSPAARLLLEKLRPLGVVEVQPLGKIDDESRFAVGVQYCGDRCESFGRRLDEGLRDISARLVPDVIAAMIVLVRTTGTLAMLAEQAQAMRTPYVLVDLAALHTVTVGPFVSPGETACAGCLVGRVQEAWGDYEPPTKPGATSVAATCIAAGAVARQVANIKSGVYPLLDRTVSINIDTLASVSEPVLRNPTCPCCADLGIEGRVPLPWLV